MPHDPEGKSYIFHRNAPRGTHPRGRDAVRPNEYKKRTEKLDRSDIERVAPEVAGDGGTELFAAVAGCLRE